MDLGNAADWPTDPRDHPTLCFKTELKGGETQRRHLKFPPELVERAWLPRKGRVVLEVSDDEINVWTQAAFNTQMRRE
jgi:hypothetical protein